VRALRAWWSRVIGFLSPQRGERDFADELQSHLAHHIDDNLRAGMTPEDARRRALVKLGSAASVAEAHRDRRGLPALESLLQDGRYALRGLARNRSFAAAAIVTLAIGIGVNSAIFSVVNGVLFAPLPYANPEQLFTIWISHPEAIRQYNAMSPDNARDLRAAMKSVSAIEVLRANIIPGNLPLNGEPLPVQGVLVSPGLFDLVGAAPLWGRTLRAGDDPSVIVISHAMWQRVFNSDPAVIGRTFGAGDTAATVVGVMPKGFLLPYPSMLQTPVSFTATSDVDFWIPGAEPRPGAVDRSARQVAVVARLKPGHTIEDARADLAVAWRQLVEAFPKANGGWSAHAIPLHEQAVAPVRATMLLLLGSVGVVLLIACVNVANLMLARGVARQRELALRAALGARRSRLLQQVIVESLVLSSIGAGFGFVFAKWVTPLLVRWAPRDTPRITEVTTDWRLVVFTMAAAVICGVIVGLMPGLGASRISVREAIGEGGRASSDGRRKVRAALVVAEVALAVVLAIGAGLLTRSFISVLNVDPGFRADHLLTMGLEVRGGYNTDEKRVALYRSLFERLEAIPGVIAVGATTRLPLGGANSTTQVAVEGRVPPDGQWPEADFRRAVHRYFETMQIPLKRGRLFTDADRAGAPGVVVINESFAKRIFGDDDPIGQQLRLGASSPVRTATIVGIVGDLRHQRLDLAPAAEVYVYYLQAVPVAPMLVIRTAADPASMTQSIRGAIRDIDPVLTVSNVRTMDAMRSASVSSRLFVMTLVVAFGGIALLLAAIGVYGVLTLVVAERTREIGIRLALGASPRGLVALIVRQSLTLTVIGLIAGVIAAIALSPLFASQLFGISGADPATIAVVVAALLAVAIVAAAIPAARVLRVDPVTTLRCD
jgi:putative ABC transport system permease protein